MVINMKNLIVNLKDNTYPIIIERKFDNLVKYINTVLKNLSKAVVVTDANVEK